MSLLILYVLMKIIASNENSIYEFTMIISGFVLDNYQMLIEIQLLKIQDGILVKVGILKG